MAKIKNNWLAQMPAKTIKGNNSDAPGQVKDLTATEVSEMLSIELSKANQTYSVMEFSASYTSGDGNEEPTFVFEYNSRGDLELVYEGSE